MYRKDKNPNITKSRRASGENAGERWQTQQIEDFQSITCLICWWPLTSVFVTCDLCVCYFWPLHWWPLTSVFVTCDLCVCYVWPYLVTCARCVADSCLGRDWTGLAVPLLCSWVSSAGLRPSTSATTFSRWTVLTRRTTTSRASWVVTHSTQHCSDKMFIEAICLELKSVKHDTFLMVFFIRR